MDSGIKIVRRINQKKIKLYINNKGETIISCPYNYPLEKVISFTKKNYDWLVTQMEKRVAHTYSTGDEFVYFGKKYTLNVVRNSNERVHIQDESIFLTVSNTDPQYVKKFLKEVYKAGLQSVISECIAYWADKMNLKQPDVKISNACSKWGSCNKKKNVITISVMTATLNKRLIEMVVLHEVCHLIYSNHQAEFYNLMRKYMEDVDDRIKELKIVSKENFHRGLF